MPKTGSTFVVSLPRRLRAALLIIAVACPLAASEDWESLANRSDSLISVNNLDSAIACLESALVLRESEWRQGDTSFATSLYKVAYQSFYKSKFQTAMDLVVPAIAIRKQFSREFDPQLARALQLHGAANWLLGKGGEARKSIEHAIDIWDKTSTPDSVSMLKAIYLYASLCNDQNRQATAVRYFNRAQEICKKRPDLAESFAGMIQNNLSNVHLALGNFSEASAGFEAQLSAIDQSSTVDSLVLSVCLMNLATAYAGLRQYSDADSVLDRASQVESLLYGDNSAGTASILSCQAEIDLALNRLDSARVRCERSLAIREAILGTDNVDLVGPLRLYAEYWSRSGDNRRSLSTLGRAFEIIHGDFVGNCWIMSESDALKHSATMRTVASQYLSVFERANPKDQSALVGAADVLLASKGIVSDEIFLRSKGAMVEPDGRNASLAEELGRAKRAVSSAYNRSKRSAAADPSIRRGIDSLAMMCDSLENELAANSTGFRQMRSMKTLSSIAIARRLPSNSVLVEYARYQSMPIAGSTRESRYMALVLDRAGVKGVIDLGKSALVDSLVRDYRESVESVSLVWPDVGAELLDRSQRCLTELYKAVWLPVSSDIDDGQIVLIAPDGSLNLVSFAGLRSEKGTYLVETNPIHYLSTGRDLCRLDREAASGVGLLAVGDPLFELPANMKIERAASVGKASPSRISGAVSRFPDATSNERGGQNIVPLPYTRREIESLRSLWADVRQGECKTLLGADANEAKFKQLAPGKRTLHLATHGYFEDYTKEPVEATTPEVPGEHDVGDISPLLRSGLYLAGSVGATSRGLDSGEDGILTALEVSDLDLSSVDLVVLSACESGLGHVWNGEGVYGLRRAFLLAGARTVVSSLWKVDDRETARFMKAFYESTDEDLPRVMQRLEIDRLAELRSKGLPDHPFLWSPFIAVGDWRARP